LDQQVIQRGLDDRRHHQRVEGSQATLLLPAPQHLRDVADVLGADIERRIRPPGLVPEAVVDPDQGQNLPGVGPVVPGPRGDVGSDEPLRDTLKLPCPQARHQVLPHRPEDIGDHGADQVILGREVVGDHAFADPGPARQLPHRSARKTQVRDRIDHAIHELVTALLLGESPPRGRHTVPVSTHDTSLVRSY
jgi:hypothetical protein